MRRFPLQLAIAAALCACGDATSVDQPTPAIVLSTGTVNFQGTALGANPTGATVQITNGNSAGTLGNLSASVTYGASQPVGWLTSSLSGTTAPSTLTLNAATGSLTAGSYDATVSIASAGASNSPRTVTVTFVVDNAASFAFLPDSFYFYPTVGTNLADSPVPISNAGGGTLSGLAVSVAYGNGPTGWLAASLSSSTAPSTLTLSFTSAPLSEGAHTATVTITSAAASNSPRAFAVTVRPIPNAVWVSQSDANALDDVTCGLGPLFTGGGGHPCVTITRGIARALAIGRPAVVVADGVYDEAVTLANGISLLGGYHPDTWERHVATTNTIIQGASATGNHDRTVIANGITSSTVFEGFVVRGSFNAKAGGNSYAIYVANSDADLVIRNNRIQAGRGGPGATGATGSNGGTGAPGIGRASDPSGYDARIATGTGACNATNNRGYANGGASTWGGDIVNGGNGGGNTCPPSSTLVQASAGNGVGGQPGAGAGGGTSGSGGAGGGDGRLESSGTLCYVPTPPPPGANGTNGSPGADGSGVAGGSGRIDSVSGGHWAGAAGATGISGSNGGGGGGGGAGGGAYCFSCAELKDRLGGHGGGGGAGGGGSTGGGGGSAGGGAFGIFVLGATGPSITANALARGEGGLGGVGGNAGAPGLGGAGGAGGLDAVFCTGAGGRGGDGGNGGWGSGGGGGSGGSSFGIYTSGPSTPNYCDVASNNAISGGTAGSGGQGGLSLINPGGAGQPGVLLACSYN